MKKAVLAFILTMAVASQIFSDEIDDNSEPVATESNVTAVESEQPDSEKEFADNKGKSSRSNFFVIAIICLIALEAMIFIARRRGEK
jgi:hypothetical protein